MGAVSAKLNSNNIVTQINSQRNISDENKKKLIEYYNKHGILNITLNTEKLKKVMNNYISNFSKIDQKFTDKNIQNYLMGISMMILMGSNTGFLLINESVDNKNVESFDNIEHFEEINNFELNENFSSIEMSNNQTSTPKRNETPKEIKVIIPKILLTSERKEFIDFIGVSLEDESFKTDKIMYGLINNLLDKISSETNVEVKIFNLINLVVRVTIINIVLTETKKLGPNIFSQDDENKFISMVIMDIMSILPSDRCLFNDDQNIFEFNPNVCNVKQNSCKECPKCEVPKLENFSNNQPKCPVCDETECDCSKCNKKENNISNIITITLIIVATLFIILYFTKKCPQISNLAKLNDE